MIASLLVALALFLSFTKAEKAEKIGRFVLTVSSHVTWNSEKDFGPISISVYNDADLEGALTLKKDLMTNRGRKVHLSAFDWSKMGSYNVLLVGKTDSATKVKLQKLATMHRVLLISEEDLEQSPSLRLILENGKLRFELDEKALEECGMKVASVLKRTSVKPNETATRK